MTSAQGDHAEVAGAAASPNGSRSSSFAVKRAARLARLSPAVILLGCLTLATRLSRTRKGVRRGEGRLTRRDAGAH